MKLQGLNRSFGKTLAAVAIAFMISSAAQAQQGQWGRDGCFYAMQSGYAQTIRLGCKRIVNGQQRYYDFRSGRWSVLTDQGWVDLQALRGNVTARLFNAIQQYKNAQAAAAARAATSGAASSGYGSGVVGGSGSTSVTSSNSAKPQTPRSGPGYTTVGGPSPAFTDPDGRPYPDSMYTSGVVNMGIGSQNHNNANWTAPNCNSSYNGCR
jgi:hypothetical protein